MVVEANLQLGGGALILIGRNASVVVEEQYSIYTVGSEMYRAHNA